MSRRGEKPKPSRAGELRRRPRNFEFREAPRNGYLVSATVAVLRGRLQTARRRLAPSRRVRSAHTLARERLARLESFASRWTHGTSRARPLEGALCELQASLERAISTASISVFFFSSDKFACCGARFRACRALARSLRSRGPDAGPRATFHLARARRARAIPSAPLTNPVHGLCNIKD